MRQSNYKDIIGLHAGPVADSCGTAAHFGKQVIVEDIETDPLWENYKSYALPHGLHSCWSTPIFGADKDVLGTFAVGLTRKLFGFLAEFG